MEGMEDCWKARNRRGLGLNQRFRVDKTERGYLVPIFDAGSDVLISSSAFDKDAANSSRKDWNASLQISMMRLLHELSMQVVSMARSSVDKCWSDAAASATDLTSPTSRTLLSVLTQCSSFAERRPRFVPNHVSSL